MGGTVKVCGWACVRDVFVHVCDCEGACVVCGAGGKVKLGYCKVMK